MGTNPIGAIFGKHCYMSLNFHASGKHWYMSLNFHSNTFNRPSLVQTCICVPDSVKLYITVSMYIMNFFSGCMAGHWAVGTALLP